MKRSTVFLVATIGVAALAAAIATDVAHRFLPGSYLGYFVLTLVSCLVTVLVVEKVAARTEPVRTRARRPRRPRRETTGERETGVVKWFDPTKGFGFIIRDVGGDVFVHRRSIRDGTGDRELREGARVTFVAVERSRGWRAEEVSTQEE